MKKLLILVAALSFSIITSCFAAQNKHTLELGTETSYIKYEEPGLMKETGSMYGIIGSYTYRGQLVKLPKCMLKAEGRSAWGSLDYTSPISGGMKNIPDWLIELRGLAGYDFEIGDSFPVIWTITPYSGIGYRYLNDDSSGKYSSLGALGYERESNYIYGPVGLQVIADLKNNWLIGATAEYDIFWWGKQISHLSDVDSGLNDPKNRQKKGYGIRGSIIVQKKGEKLDLVIEPYIRYWNIRKSKDSDLTYYGTVIDTVYEPKNNSTEVGLKLAVKF